jgi:hypothetical protein
MLKPDWCPLEEQTQDNPENKVKILKSISAKVSYQVSHEIGVRAGCGPDLYSFRKLGWG